MIAYMHVCVDVKDRQTVEIKKIKKKTNSCSGHLTKDNHELSG